MNVLILTPDRVGSTLLQRLITVYMIAHDYDKPVINLHELTNGLIKYYSPTFNQEVLGKPNTLNFWGYWQSLEEIADLLDSVDHYKTSRLAQYHIRNRQDSLAEQIPFYQYLNDNFYIISARRKNLFEHGLSWGIHSHTKTLNVYSHQEKINVFADIYKNKITIDPDTLLKYLNRYIDYTAWVDNHFTVSSYFDYEEDLPKIEDYILGLDIFNGQATKKWSDIFGIEFNNWNKCHYLISDLSGIGNQLTNDSEKLALTFDGKSTSTFQLQSLTKKEISSHLSIADQNFLKENSDPYIKTYNAIEELVTNKVLTSPVPIKLQTMLEKQLLVKNFDECVETYNNWVLQKGVGEIYESLDVNKSIVNELGFWHATNLLK